MRELRAVTLSGYLATAAQVGLDGYWMLRHARINPASLDDPERRLPAEAVVGLLEASARRSGCESFGLRLAERRSFASLGPVSLLLEHVATMRDVVLESSAYQRHFDDIVSLALEEAEGTALIKLSLAPGFARPQTMAHTIGLAFRVLSGASQGRWKPTIVHSTHRAPDDLAVWRRFFSAPVQFNDDFNGFSCSSASLDLTLPQADPEMAAHARRLLSLVPLADENAAVSEQTRRAIALMLPSGRTRLQDAAAHLGLGPRALQRALKQEGHTYGELLSEVRRELALSYLGQSAKPVTDISAQVGYSSPSAFTRWFATEFRVSPQAWRAAQQAPVSTPPSHWKV